MDNKNMIEVLKFDDAKHIEVESVEVVEHMDGPTDHYAVCLVDNGRKTYRVKRWISGGARFFWHHEHELVEGVDVYGDLLAELSRWGIGGIASLANDLGLEITDYKGETTEEDLGCDKMLPFFKSLFDKSDRKPYNVQTCAFFDLKKLARDIIDNRCPNGSDYDMHKAFDEYMLRSELYGSCDGAEIHIDLDD